MKTLRLSIELTYDDETMHANDQSAIAWFWNDVLLADPNNDGRLILHSNEIGDEVGTVKVLSIDEVI